MESALRDLKSEKFSLGEAARAHGIPYTTLRQYALKQGISVKAVSYFNQFYFVGWLLHVFQFFQGLRGYVSTKNNKALQEAVELVTMYGVATNTASLLKKVPRTILRVA